MKKKITAALLCAVITPSLAGCSKNEGTPDSTPGSSNTESSDKGESSYTESVNSTEDGDSKPTESTSDGSAPADSNNDSKPDNSKPESSKPTGSSTESKPESKPEDKPAAQKVDWSKVPVVDEMDLDYTIVKAGDVNYGRYKETAREKFKELYKDDAVVITKYFGDAEYINLPDQIEGKSCILIGADVDWGDKAKAIRFPKNSPFPNSAHIIAQQSFDIGVGKAANVTEVVMPESTISIRVFSGMPKLEIINIPDSTLTITTGAFSGCTALKSVTLPKNLEYIDASAFSGCTALESITLPESLISIGRAAFSGCSALETVNFPKKFAGECTIGDYAFAKCTSLKTIDLPEGVIQLKSTNPKEIPGVVFAGCTSLTKVSLPSTLKELSDYTFNGCTSLTDVQLPSGLEVIGEKAFVGCTSLKSIDIPDSVIKIISSYDGTPFTGCTDISINYKGNTYNEKNVEKICNKDLSTM